MSFNASIKNHRNTSELKTLYEFTYKYINIKIFKLSPCHQTLKNENIKNNSVLNSKSYIKYYSEIRPMHGV